jgi:capsular polysaccharide transport system permease protein
MTRAQIAETEGNARNSPQLQSMRQRADALERQIAVERGRVASGSDGLADKIAAYEKLMLEQQFAIRALDQAMSALEAARTETRRQQLFLERVVEPVVADQATEPRGWRSFFTVLGFNIIGVGIFWLVGTGLREHAAGRH